MIEYACVGKVYIVITEKHERAMHKVRYRSAHWRQVRMGFIRMHRVDGRVCIEKVFEPQLYNSYLAPRHMLMMLWKKEILRALKEYSMYPAGALKKSEEELAEVLADGLGLVAVQCIVIEALKRRYSDCYTGCSSGR